MDHPKKLSNQFSGALRTFSYWIASGSVGNGLLDRVEYHEAMRESPSLVEATFAIFANVIEFDETGAPINAKYAEFRAAQYIRGYCDQEYQVTPPFDYDETELYDPPPKEDLKPWP